jgi:putative transcriptional regulator
MSIKHHLDDATILSFAAGILSTPISLVASAHLSICNLCKDRLRNAELIGAVMIEDCGSERLSPGAMNNLLERLEKETRNDEPSEIKREKVQESTNSVLPDRIQRLIGGTEADIKWQTIARGVKLHMIDLDRRDDGKLYLLKIAPGRVLPEHSHGGTELTLVLAGSYSDELGQFGPGDIADLDDDIEHQPIVDPGAECICLVASEEPAQFSGVIPRMAQPFIGI